MADGVSITPGSGETVATDDVGGFQYQRIKLVTGGDGTVLGDVSPSLPMPTRPYYGTAAWGTTLDSAANTALNLIKPLQAGLTHYVTGFEVVISGGAAGADIACVLRENTTALWKSVIGSASPRGERVGATFPHPLPGTAGGSVVLAVDAGGASVITSASMSGFSL